MIKKLIIAAFLIFPHLASADPVPYITNVQWGFEDGCVDYSCALSAVVTYSAPVDVTGNPYLLITSTQQGQASYEFYTAEDLSNVTQVTFNKNGDRSSSPYPASVPGVISIGSQTFTGTVVSHTDLSAVSNFISASLGSAAGTRILGPIPDTPTPTVTPTITSTPTITPTPSPVRFGLGGNATEQGFYLAMNVISATAIPTVYSTPQVVPGQLLKSIEIENDTDCTVYVSLDGAGADNYAVPSKKAWSPPLSSIKFHQGLGVNCRAASACSSGNLYISASY